VCAGLHHAHEVQIVHRDLKPENIMLVPEDNGHERAVVMDFGLAKERRADPAIAKLTATGIILGTPEFMTPSRSAAKPLDARSDIYALGIVAFEMFTGKLPFQGRNAQEMMIARLRGQPQKLRQLADLPEGLESALARHGRERRRALQHALEFAAALTASHAALPVEDQGEAEIRRFPAFDRPSTSSGSRIRPGARLPRDDRTDPERAAVVARLPVRPSSPVHRLAARALHDIQLKRWVRTGVISKHGSGPVRRRHRRTRTRARARDGCGRAHDSERRGLLRAGAAVSDMLRAYLGSEDSPTRGRDLHVGAWH